jgi:hypothetical protein
MLALPLTPYPTLNGFRGTAPLHVNAQQRGVGLRFCLEQRSRIHPKCCSHVWKQPKHTPKHGCVFGLGVVEMGLLGVRGWWCGVAVCVDTEPGWWG